HLIDTLGFVPNGNRTYYTTRSQPPMFAMMVDLIASARADRALLVNFLPQMRAEYSFWMDGADTLDEGQAKRRVVRCANGVLTRYWDDATTPRPESYREDIALFAYEPPPSSALFQDIRAACESGWDFSARWLDDPHRLASACTRTVIPVDLNAILFSVESIIAKSAQLAGDAHTHEAFCHRAEARKALIQKMFFDPVRGAFVDLTWPELTPRPILSMATACPLFFEVATREQAERTALTLRRELLRPGGWVTTSIKTGQQWDAPNGWAPLQWFAYRGLMNYGFDHDAQEGARRWVNNNLSVYSATGALAEKYDVESIGTLASGGEYEVQTGFGWTNGVLLQLMNELGIE
ncbi:MAG: trehalase family glycosidase, partial [Myxococcota bacterium]